MTRPSDSSPKPGESPGACSPKTVVPKALFFVNAHGKHHLEAAHSLKDPKKLHHQPPELASETRKTKGRSSARSQWILYFPALAPSATNPEDTQTATSATNPEDTQTVTSGLAFAVHNRCNPTQQPWG